MTSLVDEELVLLTSYFNLSNGRRQDTADTFRVDPNLPSTSSPSGGAALYIITEASGGSHMGPRARRLVADILAREYSGRSHDSPTRRLKAAILTAHDEVQREFDGHVSVGVSVIAIEHNDVYLAQVAPAQVYVLHNGKLHSNSADPPSGSPFSRSIGSSLTPQVSLARDQITEGDVLALCSSWFERSADQDDVRVCFELESADDISASLFDLCERHSAPDATAIVIEAVRESDLKAMGRNEEDPGSFLEQLDQAVQALASVGRMLAAELRPIPEDMPAGTGGRHLHTDAARSDELTPGEPQAGGTRSGGDEPSNDSLRITGRGRTRPWRSPRRRQGTHDDVSPLDTPAMSADTGSDDIGAAWADDPAATREVPAVTSHEPVNRSQTQPADPWNPDKTATYDLGDLAGRHPVQPPENLNQHREQSTEEAPAIPPEAWFDSPSTASPETVGADGSGEVRTETVLDHQPTSDVTPGTDVETPPPFTRRRPRRPFRQEHDKSAEAAEQEPVDARTQSEIDEVNSRMHGDLDMSEVIPPVQGFADASTEPSRIYATSKDIQAVNRRPRRFGGANRPEDGTGAPRVIRPVQDLNLRQPVARAAPNALVWFAAAAVCVFALVAAGLALRHFRAHTTVANPYPTAVHKDLRKVALAAGFDAQLHYLNLARQNLALAKQSGTPAATLRKLRALIGPVSDTVFGITRVAAPVVVGKFQQPSEIASGASNLYVLDSGKGGLFAVQQNSTAAPTEIVTSGETDGGAVTGKLTHLATSGGTSLVLDNNNILVRDDGTTKTATLLAKSSPTQSVAGMINSGTDVYLLDPSGSQVWKYAGAVNTDNPAPSSFLLPGSPSLAKAVSFTMDSSSMEVLESDGIVLKYDLSGRQQAFKLSLHVALKKPVAVFTDQGLKYIWIADPGAGRIVQVDKSGNYVRSYASTNAAMNLKELKSIAVPPDGKSLFALAGTQVFRFDIKP